MQTQRYFLIRIVEIIACKFKTKLELNKIHNVVAHLGAARKLRPFEFPFTHDGVFLDKVGSGFNGLLNQFGN